MNKIRTIFIGTPDFGTQALENISKDKDFKVVSVITQPDKKVGRKQVLTPPPIKKLALSLKIPVLQPEKIILELENIKNLKPDLIIVIAYAQIIPKEILNIPKYGIINVHGSLLPKYRGASCVQAPILNGDKKTGITIMKMDEGLDTGYIIAKKEIEIHPTETTGELFDRLALLGADFLLPTLKSYIDNKIKPVKQDDKLSSYVKTLNKKDGIINWNKSALETERFIRAMTPWPSAFTFLSKENTPRALPAGRKKILFKILEVDLTALNINKHKPGYLFFDTNNLVVQCGQNALIIKKVQLEGKKEISANDFIRGYPNFINKYFSK